MYSWLYMYNQRCTPYIYIIMYIMYNYICTQYWLQYELDNSFIHIIVRIILSNISMETGENPWIHLDNFLFFFTTPFDITIDAQCGGNHPQTAELGRSVNYQNLYTVTRFFVHVAVLFHYLHHLLCVITLLPTLGLGLPVSPCHVSPPTLTPQPEVIPIYKCIRLVHVR